MANADLRRVMDDAGSAREALLRLVRELSPDDLTRARAGGWTVMRVLRHVVESEVLYVKLLAYQTGRTAPAIDEGEPESTEDVLSMLAVTRDGVEQMLSGIDDETLYRMTQVRHEEYSPLSLLENIAAHDREHLAQIEELVQGAAAGTILAARDVVTRPAGIQDLPRLTEIYNHYVSNTPITFDTVPFTVDERREWFSHYAQTGRHRLIVAERDGLVLGYASTSRFHQRAAYDTTIEMTVVCAADAVGKGIGQRLYEDLFSAISNEDIHVAMALITLPNRGSISLHQRFGFRHAMTVREVGRKFDRYWDVAWYERRMS